MKMVKDVKPLASGIVTRANKLIEARYKLSLHEQKVMYSIISLIQPNEEEFNTLRFKIAELARFCGISAKNANREMEEVTRSLLTRVLTIKEGKRTLQTHWVQSAAYENGTVEFELDQKLKPYLLELRSVFTSMKVSELMSFRSQYSGRIYELLYQYRAFGSRRFSLDELREILGLTTKEYPLFADVRRFIIEPAIKDINKNTPMDISCKTEKDGKKVAFIVFDMKMKQPKGSECLGSDMFAQNEIKAAESENTATSGTDPLHRFNVHKVSEATAAAYLVEYGEGYCIAQLQHLKDRLAKAANGAGKGITNIPKWLDVCMKNNYGKYINPASEAAIVTGRQPNPDCPKCHGTGEYVQIVGCDWDEKQKIKYKCDCSKR